MEIASGSPGFCRLEWLDMRFMRAMMRSRSRWRVLGSSTANSSPPSRATKSSPRRQERTSRATRRSASSPMKCPNESLIIFNPSMSSIKTLIGWR
jgi:hypothetical protein